MTGWIKTDAITYTKCPKCGAGKGARCKNPRGSQTGVHSLRVKAYIQERKNDVSPL